MKLNATLLLLFIATVSFAQKTIDQPIQKFLYFENQPSSSQEALQLFSSSYELGKETNFKPIYSNEDRNGGKHQKFQQYYNQIKVEFGTAITHQLNGVFSSVNGELYKVIESSKALSNQQALNKATSFVNAKNYLWENQEEAKFLEYKKPEGELVYFPNLATKTASLAFKFDIYATNPVSRQEVYVDANSGDILLANAIIKHAHGLGTSKKLEENSKKIEELISYSLGTAATRYSGSKQIETKKVGFTFMLRDETRGSGIFTYNMQKGTNYSAAIDFKDTDNNWTALEHNNANKDNGALDAHWGAGVSKYYTRPRK